MRIVICLSMLASAWAVDTGAAETAAKEHVADLQSGLAAVRMHAARHSGDKTATPALIRALSDPDPGVRREVAKALGRIKDARAVAALVKAVGDHDTNVRFYAAHALGEIKSAEAADALIGALGDPRWCVRNQAAWALREIDDPKIAPRLVAALKDKGADVTQIVWILRRGGTATAVKAAAGLLRATDANLRTRAAGMLAELGGPEVVGPLIAALEDSSPAVRRAAVDAMLAVGDRRALTPLTRLARREKDASVRKAAETAAVRLSRHGDLMAWWSFDDRSARRAKDVTGRGNDGEILRCTPVQGKVGWALRFGKGRYVELGKPAGLPVAQTPLTFMAWAKPDAPNGVIVARGGAFCGFSLYVKDHLPKFGIHRTQDGPGYIVAGREKLGAQWVHLAGVVKKDRIELYVNGKLAATAKTPGYIPNNCGQGMEIGYDVANSAAEIVDHFHGVIDEVKVYRAALSGDEIARQSRLAQQK